MTGHTDDDSLLGPYRVLDLTEGGYNWCGKVLADLGADVIKIEPPGGSPTRRRGPFYKDQAHPERSLYWYSYCSNKRGVTLNLESTDGQEIFKKLVAKTDFLLESFSPGYLDKLGLGYESLSKINPGLVMASITPFGQTGPYADYKATDMIGWAMGGNQYITGDPDRPPVRISFPQAELHAGAQAAAGSMVAFWNRQMTGEGQHVDVSMQVSVVWTLINASPFPPLHHDNLERAGVYRKAGVMVVRRNVFPCKDGFVSVVLTGGGMAQRSIAPLAYWLEEEGILPDFMANRNWVEWSYAQAEEIGLEAWAKELQDIEQTLSDFFLTKTKIELYERAVSHGILVAPCNTVQDISEDSQLESREFWVEMYHPELQASITYPGPFIKFSETPIQIKRRAPLLGEHNDEVYVGELGIPAGTLTQLANLGVI